MSGGGCVLIVIVASLGFSQAQIAAPSIELAWIAVGTYLFAVAASTFSVLLAKEL